MAALPDLRSESIAGHARGWSYIPLKGKVADFSGWQNAPREHWSDVEGWIASGRNLGLRTGSSGLVVLDIDAGASVTVDDYPPTVTAQTGGGGYHLYYTAPDYPVGNAHKQIGLPDCVHIRGKGGYVVAVGSVHPETQACYQWLPGRSPDDLPVAPFAAESIVKRPEYMAHIRVWEAYHGGGNRDPEQTAAVLQIDVNSVRASLLVFGIKLAAPDPAGPARKTPHSYGRYALTRECQAIANTLQGGRNAQLNASAFNLGQLVAAGVLERIDVESSLYDAAKSVGLGEIETRKTIHSGIESGLKRPRVIPDPPPQKTATAPGPAYQPGTPPMKPVHSAQPSPPRPSKTGSDVILVPGSHIDDMGIEHTIGTDDFAREVLAHFPEGLIVRQAMIPGQLHGKPGDRRFVQLGATDMRLLIDANAELAKWGLIKTGDHKGDPIRHFVHASHDHGELALAAAARSVLIPDLLFIANYPFFTPDWILALPGWNGVTHYYDEPPELASLEMETDPETIRVTLEDMLIDFPFKTESDRQNFIGLMLTPLIRPAIQSNTPLHMILSPLERTGKTLLAEQVLGYIVAGVKTPGMILPEHEEERDKRILSILMSGKTILHLDNLKEYLDSAVLASVLTATRYQGRLLGKSQLVEIPNNLTIVATGNNVRATGEIAKRTVPICLQPSGPNPEGRNDFVHPDLSEYLIRNRRRILGCLLGAIDLWVKARQPKHGTRLGGFNEWAGCVGGVLNHIGLTEWRKNEQDWRRDADPVGEDLLTLASQWWMNYQRSQVRADDLIRLADGDHLFPSVLNRPSDKAKQIAFGRFMASQENKPVGRWIIRRAGSGSARWYYLEETSPEGGE